MATTKATTLAHTLGGISSDISTAEINRLDGLTGDIQTLLNLKAPIASPTFTGTVSSATGSDLSLVTPSNSDNVVINSGSASFELPNTRGTDNFVLTRDDTAGTGGTAWKETMLTPTISSLTYPTGDDGNATTALDSGSGAGTQTLILNGTNFTATVSSVQITVGGVTSALGSSYVRDSATQITVSNVVKRAVGTYTITMTNDTSLTATTTVDFSGTPSFTTSASLGTVFTGDTLSKTIATSGGDGTITLKADPNGGAKPDWMSIGGTGVGGSSWTEVTDSAGLSTALAGTTANSGDTQTYNFGIIVRDSQNQGSDREFSLTVTDAPTGGDITPVTYNYNSVDYRVHKFTTVGSSNFVLYGTTSVDILLIAGGGGGASLFGAGGAGGLRWLTNNSLSGGTYSVTVGNGGDGGSSTNYAQNNGVSGDSSSFVNTAGATAINQSATGGGFGGSSVAGSNGGSGGGGGAWSWNSYAGGTGDAGSYTPDEGNSGGAGSTDNTFGGAGGGAGGAGQTGNAGGAGGIGSSTFINNSTAETRAFLFGVLAGTNASNVATSSSDTSGTLYIAAGGNAGRYGGTSGIHSTGALGGGGKSVYHSNATDGLANTGSGGGAGSRTTSSTAGGNGGSGVVIIRYAI